MVLGTGSRHVLSWLAMAYTGIFEAVVTWLVTSRYQTIMLEGGKAEVYNGGSAPVSVIPSLKDCTQVLM